MSPSTRIAIVLWSALPGLILGLVAGGGLWVVASALRLWVPPLAPLLQRAQPLLVALCWILVPGAFAVVGALEGWLKQR